MPRFFMGQPARRKCRCDYTAEEIKLYDTEAALVELLTQQCPLTQNSHTSEFLESFGPQMGDHVSAETLRKLGRLAVEVANLREAMGYYRWS